MGSGLYSTDTYYDRDRDRKASGRSAFDYHDTTLRTTPRDLWKAHATLDPKGVSVRESRDNDEHPNSLAIAVLFDVTGSMGVIPRILQQNLPDLMGLLLRKGYVADPQIMFGAIGDATCDRVPLQVGQFESDNRMEDHLGNLVLEGGGGGHITESYEQAMYFLARHTAIDCWEKRGLPGYAIFIGDEIPYDRVKRHEVAEVIGDTLQEDIPLATIVAELKERYVPFCFVPTNASNSHDPRIKAAWKKIFGQNVIDLEDPANICDAIALQIGLCEAAIDLDDGRAHLKDLGRDAKTIDRVIKSLVPVGAAGVIARKGAVSPLRPTTRRL